MFANYVGLDYGEVNCWELIRKIYKEVFSIDIGPQEHQASRLHYVDWMPVHDQAERRYDVLLFRDYDAHRHVGMVTDYGRFIHTRHGANSSIESYRSSQWKDRLKAIYRHKRLA